MRTHLNGIPFRAKKKQDRIRRLKYLRWQFYIGRISYNEYEERKRLSSKQRKSAFAHLLKLANEFHNGKPKFESNLGSLLLKRYDREFMDTITKLDPPLGAMIEWKITTPIKLS